MNAKNFLQAILTMVAVLGIAGCKTGVPINFAANNFPSRQFDSRQQDQNAWIVDSETITTLQNDADLDNLIQQNSGRVLVDFYADWCGPCKVQGKILEELAAGNGNRHPTIVKVNIEHHRELADKFQVSAVPTLLVFENGEVAERQSGLADREKIASLLGR